VHDTTAVVDPRPDSPRTEPRTDLRAELMRRARALPWRDLAWLAGAVVLLTGLSIYRLGATSLWRDEVSSIVFAKASLSDLLTVVGRERSEVGLANMATYYTILHFWLAVGETEARIRFLSVIFGVAATVPIFFVARRIAGSSAAVLAAFVYASSSFVVQWNQEVRGYSLTMLVSAVLLWLVIHATDHQRARTWLAYGIIGALGLYVHFFVGLTMASHAAWVAVSGRWPKGWGFPAVVVPVVLASIPVPLAALATTTAVQWIDPITLSGAWGTIWRLAGSPILLWATVALTAVALVAHWRGPQRSLVLLALVSVLLPIAGAAAVSLWKPLFLSRYLLVVIPPMAILAGVGLAAIRPTPLKAVAVVAMGALLIADLPSAYRDRHQEDWRGAARFLSRQHQPGDRIVYESGGRQITYYLDRFGEPIPERTRIGEARARGDERLWVVTRRASSEHRDRISARLAPAYEERERWRFKRVQLMLLEPTGESTAGDGP